VCAGLSGTADLGATTCNSPPTVVVPGTRAVAPLNTHVWIYGYDEEQDPRHFELREAPGEKSAGQTITTRARRADTGDGTFAVELVPERDLKAKTRFEVWAVGKSEHLVGTLRTGTTRDTTAPSWTGATKVEPIRPRGPTKHNGRRVIVISEADGLRVMGSRATDSGGRVLYAAWKGAAGKPIDFSRPPDGWAYDIDPASSIVVILGTPDVCVPKTFAVPSDERELQIGLAAVDLAGNRSATSEHRVKL
jgi:hypothetical protein